MKQGIETEAATQVTSFVRDTKLKVTTQIQDRQIRVTGKSKDDLQSVITAFAAPRGNIRLEDQTVKSDRCQMDHYRLNIAASNGWSCKHGNARLTTATREEASWQLLGCTVF